MLTIKKRFPWRRLYLYGSGAVIAGFAGVMTFLVQTNTNLDKFVSLAPTQTNPTQTTKTTQTADSTTKEEAQPSAENADVASDPGTTTTWNGLVAPTRSSNSPSSPASSNPTATPAQSEPTPTQPITLAEPSQPVEPTPPAEPEEPTIVDEVIEIITPPTP